MADGARSPHAGVQAQLDRLDALGMGGDVLGLDRVSALCERLGRPQDKLPPVFHVAGTNGKGSTIAFLRAALEAAGQRVHVFTSPHLVRFNERIRLAGTLISDDELTALLEEVLDAAGDLKPTFFEVTAAAAFLAFSQAPADACLIEVGLGGRLDATNIIEAPVMTGITSLGLDHQQFLGETLEEIAVEKAGIAKPNSLLVTQRYPESVETVIAEKADASGARWRPRGRAWDIKRVGDRLHYRDALGDLALPLPRMMGPHQHDNAGLAVAMLRLQGAIPIHDAALAAAMEWADWPARLQQIEQGALFDLLPDGSELWLDGGHNPSAARNVAMHLKSLDDDLPTVILFAALTSKNAEGLLLPFDGLASRIATLPIPNHDHHPPEWLAELANGMGHEAAPFANVQSALDSIAGPARVMIFGSLYLAGQVLEENGTLPA